MKTIILKPEELLCGYDKVIELYKYIPSLSHWRSWEYAAYQKFDFEGKVLDLGCGDGQYFNLIWPNIVDAIGIDLNKQVADIGLENGIYRKVHISHAHEIPEESNCFDHIFANCSLEHMDHLEIVLQESYRCLRPGATLLCSVVTNRFIEWSILPKIIGRVGTEEQAMKMQQEFISYHHLANPLTVKSWCEQFTNAGFYPEVHIPIVPKYNSALWMLMDSVWHISKHEGGEMGDDIYKEISKNDKFPIAFRKIFSGMIDMEVDWQDACGAVFLLRK